MQKCANCPREGRDIGFALDIDDAFEMTLSAVSELSDEESENLPFFLFSTGGGLFCFICLCAEKNTCVACLEECDELIVDARCTKNPLVCEDCVASEDRNHLNACEADGCMTPGEFAQAEWEMDMMLTQDEEEEE